MKRFLISLIAFLGLVASANAQCASGFTQLGGVYACQAPTFTIGQTADLGSTGGSSATAYAMAVTPTQTGTLQTLAVHLAGATTSMYMGLYDSDGTSGTPRTLLAVTAAFNGAAGWNTIPLVTPHAVTSGHLYYLGVLSQGNQLTDGGTCCTVYYQQFISTLQNPFVSAGNLTIGISEYGNVTIP